MAAPVTTLIPRLRNARSRAAEMLESSPETSRGSASTIVTFTPNDRQAEANSTPITPPPSTIAEAGKPVEPERLLAREDLQAVDLQPRQRAGYDPVASTRLVAWYVWSPTVTAGRPSMLGQRPAP